MQPLNPFLRAFFASKFPAQCSPPAHYILLVPTTEFLLTNKDTESKSAYADLVSSEDFLASHVLRIQTGPVLGAGGAADWPNIRESKAKAKQYNTVNGRTVIIKDTSVYSNKGFKSLHQAQILHDELYNADAPDTPQWLIYYISKPLLGHPETLPEYAAKPSSASAATGAADKTSSSPSKDTAGSAAGKKKDISSFHELLSNFPMISRQMQPGMEKLFRQFREALDQPISEQPVSSAASTLAADEPQQSVSGESASSFDVSTLVRTPTSGSMPPDTEDGRMRNALETLILGAIDLFRSVDKQQLLLVGEATNLSGPTIEPLIERYMTELVHEKDIFPRICLLREAEDHELESYMRQMTDVDISQVGMGDYGGPQGKRDLLRRLSAGTEVFKKMQTASSPQQMIEILLETQNKLMSLETGSEPGNAADTNAEKAPPVAAMNADALVSLLLMVVIRSSVRNLHARFVYMRDFTFLGDVESGYTGYGLSTFEGVLLYLSSNSRGLRKIARTNRTLWQAVKAGDIAGVRALLDPNGLGNDFDEGAGDGTDVRDASFEELEDRRGADSTFTWKMPGANGHTVGPNWDESNATQSSSRELGPERGFNVNSNTHIPLHEERSKPKKRVSMDTHSVSSSSERSFHSRTSTIASIQSIVTGETTASQLAQTQDAAGNSILMMAVENSQTKMLEYLAQLGHVISIEQILEDRTIDGTTLLSAAVQHGNEACVDFILDVAFKHAESQSALCSFLAAQDGRGRSVAHYCFNAPYLIQQLGDLLPWQQKDNIGHTPLFAMCRCYDHEDYQELVETALRAAAQHQGPLEPLQLDDHIDSRGNTLLHIVTDPKITRTLLSSCSADPNAQNEKLFTPLMVASKFARTDSIRVLLNDVRIDLHIRDFRGLTAVEVAKDDEVRNRIDDLILLLIDPNKNNRKTSVIRSMFVDDGSVRLILKSGAASSAEMITVTTCRRTLYDFENLYRWLSVEHPASWLPSVTSFRSPFQIPGKPSKQVLKDIQLRLDHFLQMMLVHPTFGTHEMLWEFFLVPDIDLRMLAERSRRKAEIRVENLREEFDPLSSSAETSEVEVFIGHAIGQIRQVHHAFRNALRRINVIRNVSVDLAEANRMTAKQLSVMAFVPPPHMSGFERYASALRQSEHSPPTQLHYTLLASVSATAALLTSLSRPASLIGSINSLHSSLEKHRADASDRSSRWTSALGLVDDRRVKQEAQAKVQKAERELESIGRELRYTQMTVAAELAGWQESHAREVRKGLADFAKKTVIVERARLENMRRALRAAKKGREVVTSPSATKFVADGVVDAIADPGVGSSGAT